MACKMCGDCCKEAKCVTLEHEISRRLKEYKNYFYLSEVGSGILAGLKFYRPKSKLLPLNDPIYNELAKGIINGNIIVNGPCIFLDEKTNMCIIHDRKPRYGVIFYCTP